MERLFGLIEQLKARGCGIVYITHKMEEIELIADRITVLRDGRLVGTAPTAELPPTKLVRWMVGREVDQQFPRHVPHIGQVRLRVEDFVVEDADVEVSGASRATVYVTGRLDVDASGASRVDYLGDPILGRIDTSGASSVSPAR